MSVWLAAIVSIVAEPLQIPLIHIGVGKCLPEE